MSRKDQYNAVRSAIDNEVTGWPAERDRPLDVHPFRWWAMVRHVRNNCFDVDTDFSFGMDPYYLDYVK